MEIILLLFFEVDDLVIFILEVSLRELMGELGRIVMEVLFILAKVWE